MSQQHAESYGPFGDDGTHHRHQRSGLESVTGPAVQLGPHADELAAPFIWQDGPRLLLLVREGTHWTLAELHFMTPECRYFERRRARYAWAREAAGVMLARSVAAEPASRGRLARAVKQWIATLSPESVTAE